MKKILKIFPIAALFITSVLYGLNLLIDIPENVLFWARVLAIVGIVVYAIRRKDLTTWILTSIVIGVFLGYDFPDVAIALKPLSQGFIKLVKTIVGPILFATLVYGIAGHSDLKQVGRMAWKSLLYFYCATTLALFIGLAAINLTKAGVGIDMSKIPQEELPQTKVVSTDAPILEQL